MLSPEELERKRQELEKKRRLKQKRRRARIIYCLVLILVAVLLTVGTAYYTFYRGGRLPVIGESGRNSPDTPAGATREADEKLDRINILLLGADERPNDPGRTDTIILASVAVETGQISFISIPRDTRVRIPGREGYERINAAHAHGGPELAMKTVEQFLGVPVHYYVKTNFSGFERIIDTLGGVKINVEKRMKYDDYAQDLHIDLYPGEQVLNGKQALSYVRFRADGLGDVALVDPVKGEYDGRVQRQQKFIRAVIGQVLQPATVLKLPSLFSQLQECVDTNLPWSLVMKLSLRLRDMDREAVKTALIPGTGDTINGISYWVPDETQTRVIVDRLVRGMDTVSVRPRNL